MDRLALIKLAIETKRANDELTQKRLDYTSRREEIIEGELDGVRLDRERKIKMDELAHDAREEYLNAEAELEYKKALFNIYFSEMVIGKTELNYAEIMKEVIKMESEVNGK